MDKKEVQKVIRDKMRVLGFRSKGNCFHKIIDDDYVIGIYLDHHPFCKGYYIEYGAIYLPDDTKMPFKGFLIGIVGFNLVKIQEMIFQSITLKIYIAKMRE